MEQEKKASPLNIDRYMEDPKQRIARVGVELEGAWKELPKGIVQLERDGSVFRGANPQGHMAGELPIGPFVPAAMPKAMRKYYPHKVDATCGMHVHMSFESLRHYAWLMVPEFQPTMAKYLTIWAEKEGVFKPSHHIWKRLKGENEYCTNGYWPDQQASVKRKDYDHGRLGNRYTIVHYCARQNTIEVRVLPMMDDVEVAIRAVNQVMLITKASLVALADGKDKVKVQLDMGTLEVEEREIIAEVPLTAAQRRRLRGEEV